MKMSDAWIHRPPSYRQEQEDFVSNLGGELPHEVILMFVPNVTSILLTLITLKLFDSQSYRNIQFFAQFVMIVVPSVLCCTLLSDNLINVSIAMYLLILVINFLFILDRKLRRPLPKPVRQASSDKISIITNFRAMIFLLTAICILAVDFPIFPRRFAKTENSGYSLMDTGVGLFIVANALVSPEAKNHATTRTPFFATFLKNLKNCIPLIVLGVIRALAIEYLNYQRHVTEYGVHWNFFITLAFIKLFSSLILARISSKFSFIPGLWLLSMHEYILSTRGFKEWILEYAPRDNFVSANREGLVSLPGYVGLYLCCVSIGSLVNSAYRSSKLGDNYKIGILGRKLELSPLVVLFVQLFFMSGVGNAVTFVCEQYFGVSRKLVNFGYAAWIMTLSTLVLTYLMLVDAVMNSLTMVKVEKDARKKFQLGGTHTLEMFEAINYNSLAFFLLANLLTGLINLSIKTLYVSAGQAVRIIIGYVGINVLTTLFLYRSGIQLKL